MTKLDKLIKALNEKGVVKRLEFCAKIVPIPGENKQEKLDKAVEHTLSNVFEEDAELGELFCDYAWDIAFENLIDELDIQPSEKEVDSWDALKRILIDILK